MDETDLNEILRQSIENNQKQADQYQRTVDEASPALRPFAEAVRDRYVELNHTSTEMLRLSIRFAELHELAKEAGRAFWRQQRLEDIQGIEADSDEALAIVEEWQSVYDERQKVGYVEETPDEFMDRHNSKMREDAAFQGRIDALKVRRDGT